jgi:hypothetical protein
MTSWKAVRDECVPYDRGYYWRDWSFQLIESGDRHWWEICQQGVFLNNRSTFREAAEWVIQQEESPVKIVDLEAL